MYDEFAQVYDELMTGIDYPNWSDYIHRLFFNGKREFKSILEFGCGTGNITCNLAKKGFDITAVDLSEGMLSVADEKADRMGLKNIRFYLGDMSNFQINQTFDAVISCCDSVNYLPDLEALQSFFLCSYDCLESEGLLLFDVNTSSKYKEVIANNTFVYDLDDIFCVWENEPDFKNNEMHFNLTFFEKNQDGTYNRHEETQVQYFYTIEDIHRCLINVGFKNIKYYDFGTFLPGSNEGDRIQVVAEKK
ncbi:methyltransferase domain-containing protein [Acetobacterium paludosum]|uniref:Methyltransferase domain-containing protein n=2 Tax=Acetobacterium TaxID=33951 RepID=A0A923KR33_9FIRM|nr:MULTISPECIES: class I SAM-dependent methyltransferase [Acetobacterium]MBC3798161.1 methyltransferase domain-containing protein [Acetobacterium tundrae]MBC3889759.1 methyltransferase domain-containing protein [Acetobacterium paludosum]